MENPLLNRLSALLQEFLGNKNETTLLYLVRIINSNLQPTIPNDDFSLRLVVQKKCK